jgi:hypothetical protein
MAKPNESNKSRYDALILAVASGVSIAKWCRSSRTPRKTADVWVKEPDFRAAVEAVRQQCRDEGIGVLTAAMREATEGMVFLSKKSPSDQVKLAAQKAILDVGTLETVQQRLKELEAFRARIERRTRST